LKTAAILLCLIISGCISDGSKTNAKYIVITTEKNMNDGYALILDIVQINDDHAWNEVSKLTSQEYFDKSKEIRAMKNVQVWRIDITESEISKAFTLRHYKKSTVGSILFASYTNTKLPHKIRLESFFDSTYLVCGETEITQADSVDIEPSDASVIDRLV
jgi:hypothetical protein